MQISVASVDQLWLISATLLVFCMQGGFLLIEAGRVRSKNSINVAQKNVSDFIVSIVCFSLFGSHLMFGLGSPLVNSPAISGATAAGFDNLQFLYQLGFCGAAVTIFSGAVAERMQFRCFLCIVVVLSALAYPIVGRLVWGDFFHDGSRAWLSGLGFVDFAGASVVHLFGASCGLVAAIMLGPRKGRFDEQGNVRKFVGSNPIYVLLGSMILMVSWIGFNAGQVSVVDPRFSQIVLSTVISGVGGGLAGMCVGAFMTDGYCRPGHTANGIVAGLVASTAGVHLMSVPEALLVGLVGGVVATSGSRLILHTLKIDDPLDVFAVHGLAAIAGILSVALLADSSQLPTGYWLAQLPIQAIGIVSVCSVAIVFTFLTLRLMNYFDLMKVSEQAEILGLNYSEHGESLAIDSLERSVRDALNANSNNHEPERLSDGQPLAGMDLILTKLLDNHTESNRQLEMQQASFEKMARLSADYYWSTDTHFIVQSMSGNHSGASLVAQVINRHLLDCFDIEVAKRHRVIECLENRLATGTFEVTINRDEGEAQTEYFEVSGYPAFFKNGVFSGFSGVMKNITGRKQQLRQSYLTSLIDPDTGMGNAQAMEDCLRLKVVSTRQCGRALCVASLDVAKLVCPPVTQVAAPQNSTDDMSDVSEEHLSMCKIALMIDESLREDDQLYRTGPTRFEIVMNNLPLANTTAIATTICEQLVRSISFTNSGSVSVEAGSVYAGIALCPLHTDVPDQLRLYAATAEKAAIYGRGRSVAIFETSHEQTVRENQARKNQLEMAIEARQFRLDFQPQHDIRRDTVIGFEALVRWQHPELGIVAPDQFIADVEQYNLMDRLGMLVVDMACAFAGRYLSEPSFAGVCIAVNVSPTQLRTARFREALCCTLKRHNIPASRVELELTEEAYINDFDAARDILTKLRADGFSIAIDDFGSGNTSLRYLKYLPATKLKIDRSLIADITVNSRSAEIARSVIELAQKLKMQVVAEGVENSGQASLLREWGCELLQGFYFSRPLSPDNALAYLHEINSTCEEVAG